MNYYINIYRERQRESTIGRLGSARCLSLSVTKFLYARVQHQSSSCTLYVCVYYLTIFVYFVIYCVYNIYFFIWKYFLYILFLRINHATCFLNYLSFTMLKKLSLFFFYHGQFVVFIITVLNCRIYYYYYYCFGWFRFFPICIER